MGKIFLFVGAWLRRVFTSHGSDRDKDVLWGRVEPVTDREKRSRATLYTLD